MPRIVGDKYNRKYCKQLKRGLRADGMSIEEVCQMWDICRTTYNNWRELHPEFQVAHEYGNRDCAAYWHRLTRAGASGQLKVNAGIICFALKNIDGIGWQDKVEVNNAGQEQIKQINISILPAPVQKLPHIIEQED